MFGLKLIGAGHSSNYSGSLGRTRILKDNTLNGTDISITADSVEIAGIHVDGESGNDEDGISIEESRCVLRDVTLSNQGNDGLRIGKNSNNNNLWRLYNVLCLNNGRHGLYIHDDGGLRIGDGSLISKFLTAIKTYDIPSLANGAVNELLHS